MYSAYFDRITDENKAVLLIDDLEENFIVLLTDLPDGCVPGQWLLISLEDQQLTSAEIDENKATEMQSEIENRLQRLQSRKKSKFKKRS